MAVSRRELILALGLASLATVGASVVKKADRATVAAAPALRPPARGASAAVCARCGEEGHTALDPRCPAGLEERLARQAEARRRAAEAGGRPA